MSRLARSYTETRVARGKSDRVFLDPSNRRRSRVLLSAMTLFAAVLIWLVVFSISLVSTRGIKAALPDEIITLKGEFHQTGTHDHASHLHGAGGNLPAIERFALQETSKYRCIAEDKNASENAQRVYAVVPSHLVESPASLTESCDVVDVVMPMWFDLRVEQDALRVGGLADDAREAVRGYVAQQEGRVEVLPILRFDPSSYSYFETARGLRAVAAALSGFADDLAKSDEAVGLCIDASLIAAKGSAALAEVFRPFASRMADLGLQSCGVISATTEDANLVVTDHFLDLVVVKGFEEPWVGSAPRPVAARDWFEQRVIAVQDIVAEDKLVMALGSFSVDWVSGRAKPDTMPYAQMASALAEAEATPTFIPAAGAAQAIYVDDKGRQHRSWILDAASAHNQLMWLKKRGVRGVGVWNLGYEDPGLWAVLDQAQHDTPLDGDTLSNVVFTNYVNRIGAGPFVAPVSMPVIGQREVVLDPQTNQVLDVKYDSMARPASVRLYGRGTPNKVVLTFDDGPVRNYTTETLDILKETNTPASFFVLGHNALQNPDLIERILEDGHELGSHTYWHPHMNDISASRATVEVNSVQLLVNGITGRSMRLYREPYMRSGGPITSKEVASLLPLEEAGYIITGMDIVPRDWLTTSAEELAAEVIRQVEENAGGVVLLHDGGGDQTQTVAALPILIADLRAKGYEFTSIADFLDTNPETLMPHVDGISTAFSSVSFKAVGNSWSLLEITFWSVFGLGLFRGLLLLFLTSRRKRHVASYAAEVPSVTVVIPAYNEADVITQCIERVLQSQYPYFDIIVVDDGSTDDTYAKALPYGTLPNVTVLTRQNGGKSAAMNRALFETESDVLICIDADSQIAPDAVGLLAGHFGDPDIGAVAGRVVVGNRNNLLTRLQALEYITAQSVERRAKEYLNAITVVPGAIGAWRTTALMEAGIFSTETLTEDADMTMAVIRSNYRVIYEDRAVAKTETPATVSGLLTQRLRWSLGMMQAGWKHLGAVIEGRKLGLISLPDLAIFGYLMPLLAPLADLFLLILAGGYVMGWINGTEPAVTTAVPPTLLLAYLILPVLELFTVLLAFKLDPKEDRRLLWLIPMQRVFYRQLLYISVIRALWRATTGSLAKWGHAQRAGFQFDQTRQS
ncbi:glycosyltransferase [Sulfitobacter mediterraneus]|uniref:Chitooligosaccharide deacetylase n=1 Tax=Sulfitobacter mediterraneus TaxID=83219 RepID=A0A2T6CDN8_9RHOB|nr:glycosyltransferase [Sulfitobacter mediterraneus]KIN76054.1 Glycosyl transferase, family 2 [Sulfitobacter mediterraneus KCTC 32188]PTX73614.1 cellulose synthase/poly-beta-1,6-N-acetylglucosamine synthase-like glycosyltransferase [Sulfitobacter mediterraneus]